MTSLRQRLIVGILVGITVILAGNGLAIYVIVRGRLRSEMDQALASVARSTAERMVLELGRPEVEGRGAVLTGVDLPRSDGTSDPQETWDRLQQLAHCASSIRVRGMRGEGPRAASLVRLLGRRSVCVALLSPDREASLEEVEALVLSAQAGHVDVAVLGEGAFSSEAWSLAELVGLAREVRARLPDSVELAACEPREVWLTNPDLVEVFDVLHVRYDPFLAGVEIRAAVRAVACWQDELLPAARGRELVAVGVGWPWAGNPVGDAVPSRENARRFLAELVSWADLNDVAYFYRSDSGPDAASPDWNLLTPLGTVRDEVRGVLDAAAGPPGPPAITVSDVPRRGSEGDLVGTVQNVGTLSHRVVVYIRSQGRWWNKPSFANPITTVRCDGTWTTDVTTGVNDADADAMTAFLVPAGYTPPFLEGEPALPDELFGVALDFKELER